MTKPETITIDAPVETISPISDPNYIHQPKKRGVRKGTVNRTWNGTYQKILLNTLKGYDQPTIARRVGVTLRTVSIVQGKELFKIKLTDFQQRLNEKIADKIANSVVADQVRSLFAKNALPAARRIVRMTKRGLNGQRLQLDACREVLYQIGIKPIDVIEQVKREYTPAEVQSALVTLQEIESMTKRLGLKPSQFLITGNGDDIPESPQTISQPTQETSGLTAEQTSTT